MAVKQNFSGTGVERQPSEFNRKEVGGQPLEHAAREENGTFGRGRSGLGRVCGRLAKTAVVAVVTACVLSMFNINVAIISTQTWYILAMYVLLVCLSPGWRLFTQPLLLGSILSMYNILCTMLSVVSACLFTYGLVVDSMPVFKLQATEVTAMQVAFRVYHYTKVIELLDTVWMILRHRFRQVSLLHVFHHSTMLLLSDYAYRELWPAFSVPLSLNSYIHILLYFYYWKTGSGQGRPAWRRWLTELQIVQFLIGGVHAAVGYSLHGFCPYSVLYAVTLLLLFSQFYYAAYLSPRKRDAKNKAE